MGRNTKGIDVEQLVETIKEKPALANFNLRAERAWVQGGQARTSLPGFHGAGQEETSRQAKSRASPEQLAALWVRVLDILRDPVSATFAEAE